MFQASVAPRSLLPHPPFQGPDVCVASHCFPKFSPFSRSCGCRMQLLTPRSKVFVAKLPGLQRPRPKSPHGGICRYQGWNIKKTEKKHAWLWLMVVHSTKMLTSQISFDLKWGNMMIHLWSLGVSPYNFYIFLVFVTPSGESHIFFSCRAA